MMTFAVRCMAAMLLVATSMVPAANGIIWRELDPENTVYMQLGENRVVIELNPLFAPETVAQFRNLIKDDFYDALAFYRVIDGFVAQGGDGSDLGLASVIPTLESEFEISWSKDFPFISAQTGDIFADETGFIDGFAVGRDHAAGRTWLLHCPGTIAMARGNEADSSRTDFYIVIGQAPRYLDRNMNVFGRVVMGMEFVQQIQRGPKDNDGVISDDLTKSRIRSMTLGSEISESDRLFIYVAETSDKSFGKMLQARKNRKQSFFHFKPPKVLDACQVPIPVRVTK